MDMLKMKELMAKMKQSKESEALPEIEKNAKIGVVQQMRDAASGGLADKLKNLKKVTVAADSKPGLEMGLDKAREMMGDSPETGGDDLEEKGEDASEEASESPEMEASEESPEDSSHLSDEELDQKMHELMQEKMKRKGH